jgi:hypothetical protein
VHGSRRDIHQNGDAANCQIWFTVEVKIAYSDANAPSPQQQGGGKCSITIAKEQKVAYGGR